MAAALRCRALSYLFDLPLMRAAAMLSPPVIRNKAKVSYFAMEHEPSRLGVQACSKTSLQKHDVCLDIIESRARFFVLARGRGTQTMRSNHDLVVKMKLPSKRHDFRSRVFFLQASGISSARLPLPPALMCSGVELTALFRATITTTHRIADGTDCPGAESFRRRILL